MGTIDTFLRQVRSRLTLRRTWRFLLASLLGGAGLLLAVAAVYILQGESVPRAWYAVAGIGSALVAGVWMLRGRATPAEASLYADEHFSLKDAVTSSQRFTAEAKSGGFYDLQQDATKQATSALDPRRISTAPPRRLAAASVILGIAAGLTAFVAPSQAVLDRRALEQQTEVRSQEVKDELLKELETLQKGLQEEEKELLDPQELQKWLEQIKATKDQKEAMRQLAELERKLNDASKNLDVQRKDEQLLKKAGEELQKEAEPMARELGKKLEQEQFKQAAEKLRALKPEEKKEGEKKSLDEKKKALTRLKAAAKRMAGAARQQRQKNGPQPGQERENQGGQSQSLEDLMEQLEQDADALEQAMEEGNMEQCERCEGKLGEKCDKLGKCLSKLDAKKKCQSKLLGLNKKLGQCQSYCQGRCQSLTQSPGGRKPGVGTDESRRSEKDPLEDNGQTTQLKGQPNGAGPSQVQVEAADDGTGTSHRKAEARQREFSRQFESFVQREDVPEDVKEGVKQYFNAVHEEPAKP